jgi:hypothetical protein
MSNIIFNKFSKSFLSYTEFALQVGAADNKTKGDISEEYWMRWWPFKTGVQPFIKIYNANSKSSLSLTYKFPELTSLGVGTPNSKLADLIVEYEDGYDLISCKWWKHSLDLNEIGTFCAITNQHYPNLKTKYITTTAPRTSPFAIELSKLGKDVVIIYEQEFAVDDFTWQQIRDWKPASKPKFEAWTWRNYRESKSYRRMAIEIRKNSKAKFQGPPGWGKTQLMFMLDKCFWLRYSGLTVCMSDGVTVLKQNFEHYNIQYKAHGIYRPSLVICSGADDDIQVDWPVEIVGRDPIKILQWIHQNPNGMIFCFYGNTQALEDATQAYLQQYPDFKFTFVACDEASRTCQPEGTGWSHILHDHRIPVCYRAFLDATPRIGKKIGMDNETLYGKLADCVSQPESEVWKSTTGFYLKALILKSARLAKYFHERRFIKGKSYTVEDKAMALALLREKANDPTDQHTISFGVKLERLRQLKDALLDVRNELIKKYPNVKKYQNLKDIEFFVADTSIHCTSDIHSKLNNIYSKKSRSIVFTSRLLYRGWSNVKLDSVHFADNFKGTSYIIQALGRGLRINKDKSDKICKIMVPVDICQSKPWDHLLALVDSLRNWDFRPVEAILALKTKPRGMAKRKPQCGGVVIPTNGVNVSVSSLLKNLNTAVLQSYDHWSEEKQYLNDINGIVENYVYIDRQTFGYLREEQSAIFEQLEKLYPTIQRHQIRRAIKGQNSYILPKNILLLANWQKQRIILKHQTKQEMIEMFKKQAFSHLSMRDNIVGSICRDIGKEYGITVNTKGRISNWIKNEVPELDTVINNNKQLVIEMIKDAVNHSANFGTGVELRNYVIEQALKKYGLIVPAKFCNDALRKLAPNLGKLFKCKGAIKRKTVTIKVKNKTFNSINECANFYNIPRLRVTDRCKNPNFPDWQILK